MNDLISRQAAIEAVDIGNLHRGIVDALQNIISELPSAQPEVIRCKDCRYGVDYYFEGDCYCAHPKWMLTYFGGSWDFYCAAAERRRK